MTQRQLAELAELSLATVQNIEAGRANASISTLARLGQVLGLRLTVEPIPPDWRRLTELGAPISASPRRSVAPNAIELRREVARAAQQVEATPASVTARQLDALTALVLAIAHGYPTLFRQRFAGSPAIARLIPEAVPGRLIKLKRIAERSLAAYL